MKTKRSFLTTAAAVFVVGGLLGALVSPGIIAWRDRGVSQLIMRSKQANSRSLREEYLREAMRIGWGGSAAPKAMGDYFVSIGQYDKAIDVLQNWPLKANYPQLGDYALSAQNYTSAQKFYARAVRQKPDAVAYTGLAVALFNKGDTKNGCMNAAKATKLDLQDKGAGHIAMACLLQNSSEKTLRRSDFPELGQPRFTTPRGIATFLLENRVYTAGEKQLLLSASTPSDWLILAQLASARGDHKLAAERGERGILLDVSNPSLNQLLVSEYTTLGQMKKAKVYQVRSDILRQK